MSEKLIIGLIAAGATLLASVIGNIILFFSNRRLNRSNEKLKHELQLKLEVAKNTELAKQEYIKELTNNIYAVRKSLENFSTSISKKEVQHALIIAAGEEIISHMSNFIKVYRENVYLTPLINDVNRTYMHEVMRPYNDFRHLFDNFKDSQRTEKMNSKTQDKLYRLFQTIEHMEMLTKFSEKVFRQIIIKSYGPAVQDVRNGILSK